MTITPFTNSAKFPIVLNWLVFHVTKDISRQGARNIGKGVTCRIMSSLESRIIVFVEDLKTFNEEYLLENYVDPSYMSSTYFNPDEIHMLLDLEKNGVTLRESIDNLVAKRIQKDGAICSSHDLKPLYEKYFNLKKYRNSKEVKNARLVWKKWRISTH